MEGAISIALYLFISVISSSIANAFRDLLFFYRTFTRFLSTSFRCITHDASLIEDSEEEQTPLGCKRERLCVGDVKLVVERLGIGEWREGERWREELDELLEEEEASTEEVKEAFYVFDRNEDGFITPAELWSVMRRLEMREGMRMEDCERMVGAFDEDGDGMISFLEFKRLLQDAM